MALEIQVQTGEIFTSPATMQGLILVIGSGQLLPAMNKDGEEVVLNTGSIVWVKEK